MHAQDLLEAEERERDAAGLEPEDGPAVGGGRGRGERDRRREQQERSDHERRQADPECHVGVVEVEEPQRAEALCIAEVEHQEARHHGGKGDQYMPGLEPASQLQSEVIHQ